MRRSRTLAVLAVAAAALGVLIWRDRGPSTDEATAARARLLPNFDRDRAQTISITRGAESIALERGSDGVWWVNGPRRRADEEKIATLVAELESSQIERRVAGERAHEFGLDAPRAVIAAGGATLRLGADAPDGHTIYVARDGEPGVLVVAHRLWDAVSPTSFVSTALTVDAPEAARKISVGNLALVEQPGGAWNIEAPLRARAISEKIAALTNSLSRLRASRVLPAGEKAMREPEPDQRAGAAELRLDGKLQARLRAGPGCGAQVEVERADGVRLCFDAAALAAIEPAPESLREPRLIPFSVDELGRADLQAGARRLSLRRQDHAWRIVAPSEAAGPADDAAVRDWLTALTKLRARAFVAAPTGPPTAELRLGGDGGELNISFFATAASRRDESAALALDEPPAEFLDGDPIRFRPRRVVELSVDAVDRVTVEQGGIVEEVARQGESPWRLTRPFVADADEEAVGRLVSTLAELRAVSFAPAVSMHAAVRVTAHAGAGPPITVELLPGKDGCLGRTTGPPFWLRPATCGQLTAHLATRRLFDVPGDRLIAIELSRGGEHFAVERSAAGWVSGRAPVEAARIDALVEALRGLVAERILDYDLGPRAPPAAHPAATVRVKLDGAPEQLLELGPAKSGSAPAELRGRPVRYSVAAAAVDALFAAARAR